MAQRTVTVFYSWQSDLPGGTNRNFIETALRAAADALRADTSIDVEPVVDRDTAGVPGSPDISSTIFGKIEKADIFVCDVSIVNQDVMAAIDAVRKLDDAVRPQGVADDMNVRPTPNPNVLIELGYALKVLGWKRIIMVMNDAYGLPELLPFDLRLKRVTRYATSPGPAAAGGRAADRRKLEAVLTEALHIIVAGLDVPLPGEVVQPLSLAEQAIKAVEEDRPNQVATVNRYMDWLAGEISARTPQFDQEPDSNKWDDMLMVAIDESVGLAVDFARLAQTISAMNAAEAAHALYKGFATVLELYNPRPDFSGAFNSINFDFAHFMGHELFVTLFAILIHDERWDLVADLLDDDLYVININAGRPGIAPFGYLARPVELLGHRNARLRLNRLSLHADLLEKRHTTEDLGQIVPIGQFVDADYFLNLRDRLADPQEQEIFYWLPWSTMLMKNPPRFLVEATRIAQAQRLARSLGVTIADINTFRSQIGAVARWHEKLFTRGFWHSPMARFDVSMVGSR